MNPSSPFRFDAGRVLLENKIIEETELANEQRRDYRESYKCI